MVDLSILARRYIIDHTIGGPTDAISHMFSEGTRCTVHMDVVRRVDYNLWSHVWDAVKGRVSILIRNSILEETRNE